MRGYGAHRARVGATARELDKVLVPVVIVFFVKKVAPRDLHIGKVERAAAFVNPLKAARLEVCENEGPRGLAFTGVRRISVFEAFLCHERREKPSHNDLGPMGAEPVPYFKRTRGLRREAVDGHKVGFCGKINRVARVVVHKLYLEFRRRQGCENGNAERRRRREIAEKIIYKPLVQFRVVKEEFFEAGVNKGDFHENKTLKKKKFALLWGVLIKINHCEEDI